MDLSSLEPVPRVEFRLRIVGYSNVHRGDLDTGDGITTLCGKYALTGKYEKTDDPLTCQLCVGANERRGSSRQESPAASETKP